MSGVPSTARVEAERRKATLRSILSVTARFVGQRRLWCDGVIMLPSIVVDCSYVERRKIKSPGQSLVHRLCIPVGAQIRLKITSRNVIQDLTYACSTHFPSSKPPALDSGSCFISLAYWLFASSEVSYHELCARGCCGIQSNSLAIFHTQHHTRVEVLPWPKQLTALYYYIQIS
jgi:hypothetical protein